MFSFGFSKVAGRIGDAINAAIKDPAMRRKVRGETAKSIWAARKARPRPQVANPLKRALRQLPDPHEAKHIEGLQLRVAERLSRKGVDQSKALETAMAMDKQELYENLGLSVLPGGKKTVMDPWTGTRGSASFSKVGFEGGFKKIRAHVL